MARARDAIFCGFAPIFEFTEMSHSTAFVFRKEVSSCLVDCEGYRVFSRARDFYLLLVFFVQFATESETSFCEHRLQGISARTRVFVSDSLH